VVAPNNNEIGAVLRDAELALLEGFLPELLQEMLRHDEVDAGG
jgi:hypothetical protein